jgi:hypothetical protein
MQLLLEYLDPPPPAVPDLPWDRLDEAGRAVASRNSGTPHRPHARGKAAAGDKQ